MRILLTAAALLLAAPAGQAQSWYAGVDFLWSVSDAGDVGIGGTGLAGTFVINNASDPTVIGGSGRVGYDRGNLRFEGEYSWRYRFDFNTRVNGPVFGTKFEDDLRTQTVMANVFWDFTPRGRLTPYLGAGLGVVWNESNVERTNELTRTVVEVTNTVVRPAFSLMIGANWRVAENWKVRLGYRFSALGEIDSGPFADGVTHEAGNFYGHDFMLGLRRDF